MQAVLTQGLPKVRCTFGDSPKQLALRDMREAGLDTSVLQLRRTVIVTEVEEFVFRSIDDGRILNGGRRIKRTITTETIFE